MTLTVIQDDAASETELVVDNFAGGGGASLGIEMALGYPPHYAINHDDDALVMHKANHPFTEHLPEDVWGIDPHVLCAGRPVGLTWFSPDCTHFSLARGSKPVSDRVRGLAWVVFKWAKAVKPRLIILENVKEFLTWGPLIPKRDAKGRVCKIKKGKNKGQVEMVPDPAKAGETFKLWSNALRLQGYALEWHILDAADYGAPTHRKRFFLIARCDKQPIVWPNATHCKPEHAEKRGLLPYRTAAECIDWDLPCPSIFLTPQEARVVGPAIGMKSIKRPLAENTQRRIANGLLRYVMRSRSPYIVRTGHYSNLTGEGDRFRGQGLDKPAGTVTKTNDKALIAPVITPIQNYGRTGDGNKVDDPLNTITKHPHEASKGGGFATAAVYMVKNNHGEKPHYAADEPSRTIVSGGTHHARVVAYIAKHHTGSVGIEADKPYPTTTQRGTQNQIITSSLTKFRGTSKDGQPIDEPAPTINAQGQHEAEQRTFLVKYYGTANGARTDKAAPTITSKARMGLNVVDLARLDNYDAHTADRIKRVRKFIAKYLKDQNLTDLEKLGIVELNGEPWQIIDIGMRMLTPRELAKCQGFPDNYILTGTKTSQVARIGNSVPPPIVRALVKANYETHAEKAV